MLISNILDDLPLTGLDDVVPDIISSINAHVALEPITHEAVHIMNFGISIVLKSELSVSVDAEYKLLPISWATISSARRGEQMSTLTYIERKALASLNSNIG